MTRRLLSLAVVILAAGVYLVAPHPARTADDQPEALYTNHGNLLVVAGTIRNTGTGWFVITDDKHHPINLSVDARSYQHKAIRVSWPAGISIASIAVTPDETFTHLGYTVGASVGLDSAYIQVWRKGKRVDPDSISVGAGNIWILALMEARPTPDPTVTP